MKRLTDILVALAVLIVCTPIMSAITLAILVTDGRPILYRSRRVGHRGGAFAMLKFRSMSVDGDARLSPHDRALLQRDFKLARDPRCTPLGAWLRRWSLDELPQLFNVLIGDMSMVGPRPKLPEEIHLFGAEAGELLSVRPGLTGLWQICREDAASDETMRRMDLDYVRSRSVWVDYVLLLQTPWAVLRGRNG